ncbi:MAG: tripartite tricarboxylate transporter substrate binding protein, partial [Comamonadaceae bacterium]
GVRPGSGLGPEPAVAISYVPGGIGAVAFDRAVKEQLSDPGMLVAFSSGSLLNLVQGKFGPHGPASVRWLAILGTDYGVIAVKAGSRIRSLADLQSQLSRGATRVVFGAGGTVGSQDWIKAALIVRAAGRDHRSMRFVSFEGGGEALAALQGGHVDVYAGDASEVRALLASKPGSIQVIAVLSEQRLPGILAQVPTAREAGVDVVWPTVRGVYLGPGVPDADYRGWSQTFARAMAAPGYAAMRDELGMYPLSLTGPEVGEFVAARATEYRALAKQLGLRVAPH